MHTDPIPGTITGVGSSQKANAVGAKAFPGELQLTVTCAPMTARVAVKKTPPFDVHCARTICVKQTHAKTARIACFIEIYVF